MIICDCVLLLSILVLVVSVPFDDGRYRPKQYEVFDDGRYYRPNNEGKYVPGDEGRYTYVYQQGLYPTDDGDYRYRHQIGPNGNGGGFGGEGGFGSDGPNGPNGPREPNRIEYIGKKTYAERYPYLYRVIKQLVNKYVSPDVFLFGDMSEGSDTHFNKALAEDEIIAKCKNLYPNYGENLNTTESNSQYPPRVHFEKEGSLVSYYTFKGRKNFNLDPNMSHKHMKIEYEVYVKVLTEE